MTRTTENNTVMRPLEWGMLLALSLLWGGSFFFVGVAVKELPTLTIVVSRVLLAAIILNLVLIAMRIKIPMSGNIWAAFFVMGFFNNVIPFSLIAWGQHQIGSGVASILNATTPLFTVIVAHWLTTNEKMTGGRIIGILIGLAGIIVMVGGDVLQSMGGHFVAQLACLSAALSYAFASIFGRRFMTMGISPMATATGQLSASSLMMIPMVMIVDQPWTLPVPSLEVIGALVGVATLSTSLAYILFFRILATAGATNVALTTFLIPVSAILLGVLILGEVLTLKHYLGMILIGCGLAAIDGRLWRYLRGL